eukprot:TRINITY_DN3905_c0_g1_i2.p2 TRINITY_DN3905_c0_g1~~TRINITY_DN3905_c0_g1_i2.p2  ORF type:complete len:129 (+),score=29.92 TRINITY_DN3905_c0_g1_i2:976-1362(+)
MRSADASRCAAALAAALADGRSCARHTFGAAVVWMRQQPQLQSPIPWPGDSVWAAPRGYGADVAAPGYAADVAAAWPVDMQRWAAAEPRRIPYIQTSGGGRVRADRREPSTQRRQKSTWRPVGGRGIR